MENKKLPERFYKFIRPVLGFIFKVYYNPKVYGKENIPKEGSIIVAGNHKHVIDQCGIIISTKRVVHYMAKKEYFDGKFAWFFKASGCISVNRSIHDDVAKETAINLLKDGGALGIFPEGTRNKTKEFLLPFKFGCVSMAKKTDSYIVPFSVTGDYKFRSKNLVYRIGKPFKVTNMELSEANKRLERAISSLKKKNLSEERKMK
jgi:1-acyl-sn-glycerol-3-phosphate acyltransferase